MNQKNAGEFFTDPMFRGFRDYCDSLRYEGMKLNLDPSLVCNGVAWNFRKAVAERDARIAELERVLESLVRAGNYLKETAETHVMQTYDTRGSVGRKISEWDAALADIKTVLGKGER